MVRPPLRVTRYNANAAAYMNPTEHARGGGGGVCWEDCHFREPSTDFARTWCLSRETTAPYTIYTSQAVTEEAVPWGVGCTRRARAEGTRRAHGGHTRYWTCNLNWWPCFWITILTLSGFDEFCERIKYIFYSTFIPVLSFDVIQLNISYITRSVVICSN